MATSFSPSTATGFADSSHTRSASVGMAAVPKSEPAASTSFQVPDGDALSKPREGQTRRGVCKFFNSQKGFGFVLDNNAEELGGQEVFVHFTAIQSKTGFRSLAEGEEVEYEITTGPKGFQASRLTGPGGRPVIGDPKARLMKQQPQFMQLAPIAFPGAYGMDPYGQHQHPGAVYAASPYNVVYVPTMQPGQQGQFAQLMPSQAQFSPSLNGANAFNGTGNTNPAAAARNSAQMTLLNTQVGSGAGQAYGQMPSPSGGNIATSSTFGPVGGMAAYQAQSPFGGFHQNQFGGSRFSNGFGSTAASGLGLGTQATGAQSPAGQGNTDSAFGTANEQRQSAEGQQNFFGSGNLLYSSN